MGINGLLPSLRSVSSRVHLSVFRGQRVAVDAHCWLYKGSVSCSREIVEGIQTTRFIDYFLDLIRLLQSEELIPVIVFDGRSLPVKEGTNLSRRESKQQNKAMAREAEADGRSEDAKTYYQRSFSVSPEMVFQLIKELKKMNIEFIVSPYESDAELAFLSLSSYVDLIITEDSDALVYGCRRVLYKLDQEGYGEEIKRKSLGANEGLSFLNWNDEQFKLMCCLSGCDYAPKIRNVGIITAHKIVNENKTILRVIEALRRSKYQGINDEYIRQLLKALYTFKHQTVYNPITKQMQPLTPFGDAYDWRLGIDYLGEILDPATSEAIATGMVHPSTLQPVVYDLDQQPNSKEQNSSSMTNNPRIRMPQTDWSLRNDQQIGTAVWSALIEAPKSNVAPLQALHHDDISPTIETNSPHKFSEMKSNDNLWEFPTTIPKLERIHEKETTVPSDLTEIRQRDFVPVQGIEILHRRKRKNPPTESSVQKMFVELNPWSRDKRKNSLNIFSNDLTPNKIHRPPNQQIEISTQTDSPNGLLGAQYEAIFSPMDRKDSERSPRGSMNDTDGLFLDRERIFSPRLKSPDRYSNVGMMKYQSRSPLEIYHLPFTLPKR